MTSCAKAKQSLKLLVIALLLLDASAQGVYAQAHDVKECDSTLVMDRFSRSQKDYWSACASSLLTKENIDNLNHQFAGGTDIYGIHSDGKYNHDQAQNELSKYKYDATYSNQDDVLRSVLSTNATSAYSDCLAKLFNGMAIWVADIGAASVTIKFDFRTANDDLTARTFLMAVTGGDISDLDKQFFSQPQVGSLREYPVVIGHHAHEEVIFQVLNVSTREKVVIRVPLRGAITYTDWDKPKNTPTMHAQLIPAAVGQGRDGNFCVTASDGAELIPGSFIATNVVLSAKVANHTGPLASTDPGFQPSPNRICQYASVVSQGGVFGRMDFDYWAQEHKKVTVTLPELAAWLPEQK
jgi:hypothetical protein